MLRTSNLRLDGKEAGVALLTLDVAGRSVNVLHRQLLDDLDLACEALAGDPTLQSLIIASGKPSGFVAGADIHELAAIDSAATAAALSARGQQVFARLESLPVVSVALIHGPCLGGGLELALACDYRVVSDDPKTLLGLPEVELGLLPAWGGTQRLPRVTGLQSALRMILGGKRVNAAEAGQLHLADLVLDVSGDAAIAAASEFVRGKHKRPKAKLPRRTWKQVLLEGNPLGRRLIFRGAGRTLRQRVPDDMPAPAEALAAIQTGVSTGMPAGLAREQAAVGRLATSPACRNLVGLFLNREAARALPAELREHAKPIRKVGVVGGGVMGAGIAQLAALKGCQVVIQEAHTDALGAATLRLANLFRQAVDKGALHTVEMVKALSAIKGTVDWKGFDEIDLAIEAVTEEQPAKEKVFAELEQRVPHHAILATNTSSLRVADLQAPRRHPKHFAGLHFFNPVHKMPLIEVVPGPHTSDTTIATLLQWAIELGKTPVRVKDSPGFVVNRVLAVYLHEARLLVQEGGDRKQIDRVMRRFGMPVGPLETIDMIGPALVERIEASLRPFFGQRFQADAKPKRLTEIDEATLRDRLVLLMVNEAAACLGEGLTADAGAIDLALVLGAGWAPHRGGPLRYADALGPAKVMADLTRLAAMHGPRFEPCEPLRRRAKDGLRFYPEESH